jgi:Ca2+-binding RTX toxin-like protein
MSGGSAVPRIAVIVNEVRNVAMKLFRPQTLVAGLTVAAALAAYGVPAASADDSHAAVLLNNGVLSIGGTPHNDVETVSMQPSPSTPGGYRLVVNIGDFESAQFSANCTESGEYENWNVSCPAQGVTEITFDGHDGGDSFFNNTDLPSLQLGGPGVDFLHGGGGPDVIDGGADNDNLSGNGGDDTLDGGAGTDTISGGPGTDIASYADATGPVTASLDGVANDGQAGENENIPSDVEGIQGGSYDDTLSGGGGNSTLLGGDGADDLQSWNGDDVLRGQGGNDTLHPSGGADVLDGGDGVDTLSYAGVGQSVYVYQDGAANDGMLGEHDNVTSIEHLTGSSYGDDLEGTSGNDVIHGGAGSDKIDAKSGDDVVYGDEGSDNISGGPGPQTTNCPPTGCTQYDTDTVVGGSGSDTIDYSSRSDDLTIAIDGSRKSGGWMENDALSGIENANGGSGDDTIYGNDASNSLSGGPGNDGIAGGKGNDYVAGGEGNDFLEGDGGNNWITGADGNDTLEAGGGNDTLYGGPGTDLVTYYNASGSVTAHIGTGTSGQAGEADTIGADVENLEGSAFSDKLYGNAGPNKLIGDGGGDLLVGGGGKDNLQGGPGADTLQTKGDGVKDSSSCGAGGGDVAKADKLDAVAADCETVQRG